MINCPASLELIEIPPEVDQSGRFRGFCHYTRVRIHCQNRNGIVIEGFGNVWDIVCYRSLHSAPYMVCHKGRR